MNSTNEIMNENEMAGGGEVPQKRDFASGVVAWHDRGNPITEQYRALRTSLLAQYPAGKFCIMVTSAEHGEGKTVTCANLAAVLAENSSRKVLIVDCNLRGEGIASVLNLSPRPGLADLIRDRIAINAKVQASRPTLSLAALVRDRVPDCLSLDEVIQTTEIPNVSVIAAGFANNDDASSLLGRPELDVILQDLRQMFDYILLDTPAVNKVADAGLLGRMVGEAMLVVRMNQTRQESVNRAIGILHAANVKIGGMVLTHQKYFIPNFLYKRL